MKIVILSFSFLKPEHIARLQTFGEVVEYESTNKAQDAIERVKGAEVVIADCWDVPMDRRFFEGSRDIKYISLNSTGFNQVDLSAAKDRGVLVANVPGFSTDTVAEHAVGLMLAVARHIPASNTIMQVKPFQVDPANRAHDAYEGSQMRGKTLGVFGLGQIGQRVAELGNMFGMQVIGTTRTAKQIPAVEIVDFDTMLKRSDFISINSAYVSEMKNLFNKEAFSKMKPSTIIVNTARGDFMDEIALRKALDNNEIYGYGADLLADWSNTNPLLGSERVVLTPHSAWFTKESVHKPADTIVKNVESYVNGNPENTISI